MTHSITTLSLLYSIVCHHAECRYAECRNYLNVMQRVVKPSVVMLNVVAPPFRLGLKTRTKVIKLFSGVIFAFDVVR
jgi:hypothetical protein